MKLTCDYAFEVEDHPPFVPIHERPPHPSTTYVPTARFQTQMRLAKRPSHHNYISTTSHQSFLLLFLLHSPWRPTKTSTTVEHIRVSHARFSTTPCAKRKKMPPKKQVKEEKILLGRPGNNLKSGIVRQCITTTSQEEEIAFSLTVTITGRTCQCWEINSVPSHYQMFAGQSCGMFDFNWIMVLIGC